MKLYSCRIEYNTIYKNKYCFKRVEKCMYTIGVATKIFEDVFDL